MPVVAEVRFSHEDGALADTLQALPELDATVIRETGTDPENDLYVFRFEGDQSSEVDEVLEEDHTVLEARPMRGFEDELWGIRLTPETKLLSPLVVGRDGFVLDARTTDRGGDLRGWQERWLLPDRDAIQAIWMHARSEGFEFVVLDFWKHSGTDPEYSGRAKPTVQQQEALVVAYERGYFSEPRETSLEELGEELGISPTAVGGRLKRGMKSLVGMTIMDQRSGRPRSES